MPQGSSDLVLQLDDVLSQSDGASSKSKSDEARAYIHTQISGLQESIRKRQESIRVLKSVHNRLAPISRLPAELLSLIFKGVRDASVVSSHDEGLVPSSDAVFFQNNTWKDIIQVTHVCRSWRQTALECASLWSRPIFDFQVEVLQEMISRSKGSPLSIRVTTASPVKTCPQALDLTRMQELHISLLNTHLHVFLDGLYGNNANTLRSLYIKSVVQLSNSISLDRLLSTYLPHLQSLVLDSCTPPWDLMQTCIWDELVRLSLRWVRKPTRQQFYDFLSRTPNLESLELQNSLPVFDSQDLVPTLLAALPRLTSLTAICSSLSQHVDFQNHVSYPSTRVKMCFGLTNNDNMHPNHASSIISLFSCFGLTVQNPSRSHHNLAIILSVDLVMIVLWDTPYEPAPRFFIQRPIPHELFRICFWIAPPFTYTFLSSLSIPGLRSVSFCSREAEMEGFHAEQWSNFFQRHPDVTHLHVHVPEMRHLSQALSMGTGESSEGIEQEKQKESDVGNDGPRLLPNLVELALERYGGDGLVDEEDFGTLIDCLDKRRNCGAAIKVLSLFSCSDGIDDERLRKLVGQIKRQG